MLRLSAAQRDAIVATCVRALPNEGCGLLLGDARRTRRRGRGQPQRRGFGAGLRGRQPGPAARAPRADDEGLSVIGVFHSHTHTEAYPSPTDVAQAPDPSWHYVLVSLRDRRDVRAQLRIVDGGVDEEPVAVADASTADGRGTTADPR